ncbi:MAG: hypothetical protein ACRDUY_16475 [Nitriliruptorales bacterium]
MAAGVTIGGRAGTALAERDGVFADFIEAVSETPVLGELLGRGGALLTGHPLTALSPDFEESLRATGTNPVERFVTGRDIRPSTDPADAALVRGATGERRSFEDIVGPPPDEPDFSGRDPLDVLAGLDERFAASIGAIDSQFEAAKGRLSEMFQFAETPEEQAQLAFVLGDLEEQSKAAKQVIANEYGKAVAGARERSTGMRETAAAEGQQVGDIFRGAADRVRGNVSDAVSQFSDTGLGVEAAPVSGDATDFLPLLESDAATQQALTQQLGDISAADVAFLGEAMAGEGAAQQGDLQRLATGLRAGAITDHQRRVGDRQAGERAAYRDALLGLESARMGRQFDLEDRSLELALTEAGLLEDRRTRETERAADRRDEFEDARRGFALQGELGGGGDPQSPIEWAEWLSANPVSIGAARAGLFGPEAQQVAEALGG